MHKLIKQFTCIYILFNLLVFSLSGEENRHFAPIVEKLDIIIPTESAESTDRLVRTIQARLKTKVGTVFSQSDFDSDLKMLIQDYDRVEPHVESHDGRMDIQLKIWQNPRIRRIIWEGVEKVKCPTLKKELSVQEGSLFNRSTFGKQFNQIKVYYIKEGFFETEVSYETVYDEATNEVDIYIRICEGRAGKIKNIIFCNFTNEEQAEIAEMMVTKKYNFFLTWLSGEGIYNEDAIQHDRFIILNYLQNKGFADARVNIEVKEAKECNRIIICISADRGECYSIGELSIEGNCIFSKEDLMRCIKICPGDPYSPERLHLLCEALMNYYGKFGYIESAVIFEPQLVEGERCFNIKILIEEGEQYCVGLIKVLGNCTTQTNVILHETLVVPGEIFNLEKLKKTEERLINIGYFSNVNVYAVKTSEDSLLPGNYRDVHIEVEETNTGNLGAFFGFSTVENMFGGINISERNFNYKGLSRLCRDGYSALRGGGEFAQISLSVGTRSRSYGLSWTKPYFKDTPWSVGFDLERSDTGYISKDISIKSNVLTLHATYLCNAFVKVGPHIRLQYSDIHIAKDRRTGGKIVHDAFRHTYNNFFNRPLETPILPPQDNKSEKDKEEEKKKQNRHSDKDRQEAENAGLIAAVGMSWIYNSTNHPICPTRGFKSTIEGEVAGFNAKHCFLSLAYINSYYYNVYEKVVLRLRGDFRFIQPMRGTTANDLPLDERFLLGGDNDVRGYRPFRLGPKFNDDPDEPKGGISMQLFSAELSRPVFSRMDAFVFADAGAISMRTWQFGGYFYSLGFGARIKIFEGGPPLTLGMGFPLNAKDSSDVKKFFLTVGGKF